MFWCCCTGAHDESKVKAINNTDEWEPVTGTMAEEAMAAGEATPIPGDPVAVTARTARDEGSEPPLGRIDEVEVEGKSSEADRGGGETFLVTLKKDTDDKEAESPYGVSLFYSDVVSFLEIIDVDVNNPSVAAYNNSVEPRMKLQAGQLILAVNGIADSTAMMLAGWKDSAEVNCVVCWPTEFQINVSKSEGGMGIDVTHSKKGRALLVEGVHAGPVQRWNAAHPDRKVQVADRIVAVNKVRGSPTELKNALKTASGVVELVIARRP